MADTDRLKSTLCYKIADTLGMTLSWNDAVGRLVGGKTVDLRFGDVLIPFTATVIESAITHTKHSIIAKIAGNLHLLVTATDKRVRVYVMDYAKIDGESTRLLDRMHKASEHKLICSELGRALVACYETEGLSVKKWVKIQ